jgi:general secretion pathway protein G
MTEFPAKGRKLRASTVRSAFTLIEVLLVLIILVILASLAVTQFGGIREQANIDAAKAQIGIVKSAIEMYKLHANKYPPKLQDLWEEPSDSALADKWAGPYMDEIKKDPWENEYKYSAEGKKNSKKYDFWSMGPDGKDGTEDDIGNWEKKG